ncbi:MAG: MFS transporter [candidate division FCPU426 bacterium]
MSKRPWLTRNVFFIGLVSLFTDIATEMAVPLFPKFLESMGGGARVLGLIEGASDALSSLLKYFTGKWSDLSGKRRPWVLAGYLLSSAARPFLALATASWHVLAIRMTDRTGKGLRSSPRDALIADSVPERSRGAAFGFHQGMDHVGAVLGPLAAVAILIFSHDDLRLVFALAAIPGAVAVLTLWSGVTEIAKQGLGKARAALPSAAPGLFPVLLPLGLFTLGNASDLFLLKKAGGDMPLYSVCLLWSAFHVVKASASLPGGHLSDRIGPRLTISLGWLLYAAIYFGFAMVQGAGGFLVLFVVYGLYFGLTEGAEKAWIASLVPPEQRATAFGWYYLVTGVLALPASLAFGWIWDLVSPQAAFLSGSGLALSALACLWFLRPAKQRP